MAGLFSPGPVIKKRHTRNKSDSAWLSQLSHPSYRGESEQSSLDIEGPKGKLRLSRSCFLNGQLPQVVLDTGSVLFYKVI